MRNVVLAALILASSAVAAAEPFHVAYRIDRAYLRRHLAAGQVLSVGFYGDPLCTSAIASIPIPVDDPLVVFEKVEQVLVPGERPRRGPLALVSAVVDLDAPPGALFVAVAGDAIRAVGGDCQAQSGLTGPAGPQGATGAGGATGAVGPTGATGATGPQGDLGPSGATGATGEAGADGATGATGQQGGSGVVGVYRIYGGTVAIPGGGANGWSPLMFVNAQSIALPDPPYKLFAVASTTLAKGPSDPNVDFEFGFCFQQDGGPLLPFENTPDFDANNRSFSTSSTVDGSSPVAVAAAASISAAGTYTVGLCGRAYGDGTAHPWDAAMGFVMVVTH